MLLWKYVVQSTHTTLSMSSGESHGIISSRVGLFQFQQTLSNRRTQEVWVYLLTSLLPTWQAKIQCVYLRKLFRADIRIVSYMHTE